MDQEMYSFNLKDAIKSFKLFPKIFRLLWSIKKLSLIFIVISYIIRGLLPAMSIISTQILLNAIQTSVNKKFSYVLHPLIIYLSIIFLGYIISQLKRQKISA